MSDMTYPERALRALTLVGLTVGVASVPVGCLSPAVHRAQRDAAALERIEGVQQASLGVSETIDVHEAADTLRRRLLVDQNLPYASQASLGVRELPANDFWEPEQHLLSTGQVAASWTQPADRVTLGLVDALHVGAHSSRDFQSAKAALFASALDLDLEEDTFRRTFNGMLGGGASHTRNEDDDVSQAEGEGDVGVTRSLLSGVQLTSMIAVDLVKLLTQETSSTLGIVADASISIPLLRGAGKRVAGEGLTQAQRNLQYAVHDFERFKQRFAVDVTSEFLNVLLQKEQLRDVQINYTRLQAAASRAKQMSEAGRLPEVQYDQAVQDELRSRTRLIDSRQSFLQSLDRFKVSLGLPADAEVSLDDSEFERIRSGTNTILRVNTDIEEGAIDYGSATLRYPVAELLGMTPGEPMSLALSNRLDLKTALARVEDAQRNVYIQADALRPELTLLGRVSADEQRRSGRSDDDSVSRDRDSQGASGLLTLDLGLERSAESRAYRASVLSLQDAVRDYQSQEDEVKLDIRNALRQIAQARENVKTQLLAVSLAEKRVRSTDLFLQAGRVEIRDVLEAEDALLSARNSLNSALVGYHIAELSLQRDMGLLRVTSQGVSNEYEPENVDP